MSIVSGTLGAVLSADAQGEATDANRANARETNALNREQFYEARGKGGFSVLPYYMRGADGKSLEEALGKDLYNAYTATGNIYGATPEEQAKHFKEIAAQFAPMTAAANKTGMGIFNGDIGKTLEANAAPVWAARKAFSRQASIDALNKTMAQISATQAAQGFKGDSMGNRLLTMRANREAADREAGTELQNLTELQAIRNRAGVELPLQYMSLPAQLAQQALTMENLPTDAYLDNLNKRLQPLTFMRIGAGQPFQYQPLPSVTANPSAWQLMAQAGAGVGNMAANYWSKQQQAKAAQDMANTYMRASTGNYGTITPQNAAAWGALAQNGYAGGAGVTYGVDALGADAAAEAAFLA